MADPKFDPAAHAAQALQLKVLADQARAALRKDTVERTSRIGQDRDEAARRAYGAEQEAAATKQQDERELNLAEKLDGEAAVLERRASEMEHRGVDRGTAEMAADLREQAAEQRALAEAARNRGYEASQAGDRLRQEAIDQRAKVAQLEADLAAEPQRRQRLEEAVDNLEFNAGEAAFTADQARKAVDLEARAESAVGRGDLAAAAAARAEATTIRDDINQRGLNRELFAPAADQLGQLGVTVPPTLLAPPGFALSSAASEAQEPAESGFDPSLVAGGADVVTGDADVVTRGVRRGRRRATSHLHCSGSGGCTAVARGATMAVLGGLRFIGRSGRPARRTLGVLPPRLRNGADAAQFDYLSTTPRRPGISFTSKQP